MKRSTRNITTFFVPQPPAGREWCWGLVNGTGHLIDESSVWHVCEKCGKGHCLHCSHISTPGKKTSLGAE